MINQIIVKKILYLESFFGVELCNDTCEMSRKFGLPTDMDHFLSNEIWMKKVRKCTTFARARKWR